MKPKPAEAIIDGTRETAGLLELAGRIAPVIEAGTAESEARREMTGAVFKTLLDAGFYRLLLPRSVGGFEVPPSRFSQLIERIARADGSAAWCLGQAGGCAMAAAHLEPEVAKEMFEPARAVLAWGAGPRGQALSVEGGYEISGTWLFASGGRQANWMGAHVPLCEADGTPRHDGDGKPLVRTMLFPAAEAKLTDVWHVMGLRARGATIIRWRGYSSPRNGASCWMAGRTHRRKAWPTDFPSPWSTGPASPESPLDWAGACWRPSSSWPRPRCPRNRARPCATAR